MNNKKRKALVEKVANEMCANENRISTKRLKIEMRNQYPNQTWNKYNDGKNSGVSDYFHELVQEGKFGSIADNGTYQTYACKALPIVSKKGDTYIHDAEESIVPKGNPLKQLVKVLKGISKPSSLSAFSATVLKTAQAIKPTATKATVSTNVRSTNAKSQPRQANGKFASRTTAAPVAAAAGAVKSGKTATSKTHNVKTISRIEALKRIQNYKGKLKFATFVKQDGTDRTMRFDLIDPNPTPLGYLKVTDLHVAAKKDPKDDGMRNINMQTLKHIKLGRKASNVR